MQYIVGGRGCGKTHSIILESAKTGVSILCVHQGHKEMIMYQARLMRVSIPEPVCISDVRDHNWKNLSSRFDRPIEVLIDDPMYMLQRLIGTPISIKCCCLDVESLQDVFILPDRPPTYIYRDSNASEDHDEKKM